MVKEHIGEVVLLEPDAATWTLSEVDDSKCFMADYLERQFLVNETENIRCLYHRHGSPKLK